jgi:hypothetical protein
LCYYYSKLNLFFSAFALGWAGEEFGRIWNGTGHHGWAGCFVCNLKYLFLPSGSGCLLTRLCFQLGYSVFLSFCSKSNHLGGIAQSNQAKRKAPLSVTSGLRGRRTDSFFFVSDPLDGTKGIAWGENGKQQGKLRDVYRCDDGH